MMRRRSLPAAASGRPSMASGFPKSSRRARARLSRRGSAAVAVPPAAAPADERGGSAAAAAPAAAPNADAAESAADSAADAIADGAAASIAAEAMEGTTARGRTLSRHVESRGILYHINDAVLRLVGRGGNVGTIESALTLGLWGGVVNVGTINLHCQLSERLQIAADFRRSCPRVRIFTHYSGASSSQLPYSRRLDATASPVAR